MKSIYGILLSFAMTSFAAVAAPNIQLGQPGYAGNGCPAGSASVSLSPDQTSVSILFDQFVAEAGGSKSLDRKACNIAIPVKVPQGYSVSVFAIDYRGFADIPRGASAELTVNYFLPGMSRGVVTSKKINGPYSDEYTKRDSLGLEAVVWSACGADTILRANSSMIARSNPRRDATLATVDSVDVQAGIVYHFQWRRCN